MKKKHPLILPLIAALLPAMPVEATVPENKVTVNATITYQKDEVFQGTTARGDGGKIRGVLGTLRINTKDLLRTIADTLAIDLPKGAHFLHVSGDLAASSERGINGGMWIVDADGVPIAEVSGFFNMFFNFSNLIYAGTIDLTNGSERTKNRFPFEIRFDFPLENGPLAKTRGELPGQGVFLQGNGVMREGFVAKTDRDGTYRASDKGLGNGYVEGFVGDNFVRGGLGGNALGFFNVRISGKQVILD